MYRKRKLGQSLHVDATRPAARFSVAGGLRRPAARRAAGPATGSRPPSRRGRSQSACIANGRFRHTGKSAVQYAPPCVVSSVLLAISEFPKWRKYLILLSFLDNSSARPVQIGGVDVNICHSRVDRSPRTPAVQFAIPPRGDHFVAHGRALWKLTGRGRTERAHRALENAVRFPRASTGPFPSSHPRKTPKGP